LSSGIQAVAAGIQTDAAGIQTGSAGVSGRFAGIHGLNAGKQILSAGVSGAFSVFSGEVGGEGGRKGGGGRPRGGRAGRFARGGGARWGVRTTTRDTRMGRQYFPTTDNGLLLWSRHLSDNINASPGEYGVPVEMAESYAVLHQAFAAAMRGVDPGVRNKAGVTSKNTARSALKSAARLIVMQVRATATVTEAQQIDLGLTIRGRPTPIARPTDPPAMDIVSVSGHTVRIRLHDSANIRRRKPAGVQGAAIFSFVGPETPNERAALRFEGITTRTKGEVTFPMTVAPGENVWLTAAWFNPRTQSGPMSAPVRAIIQFGGEMPKAMAMAA
jgi:hypothetical protein